jgi:hypothetical protein
LLPIKSSKLIPVTGDYLLIFSADVVSGIVRMRVKNMHKVLWQEGEVVAANATAAATPTSGEHVLKDDE